MKKVILVFLTILTMCSLAFADSLYQTTVSVPSESQTDLQAGISQALSQVLVKVSGSDKVLSSKKIKDQLGQAAAGYVQSYSYINNTSAGNPNDLNNLATKTTPTLMLQVQFYPKAIDQLLQGASIKSWSKQERTPTLIWLATQTPQGKTIISNNSNDTLAASLQNNAANRGLPILLPMMDLQDMQNVGVNDIWQLASQGVLTAAKRYSTQNILEGKIYSTSDQQWYAQWILFTNGQNISGNAQGSDANEVIATMLNKVADNMAAKDVKAISAPTQDVTLRINNVNGLDDYADIEKYLRSIPAVTDVQVASIDPDALVLSVKVSGGTTALSSALNAGTQMQSVPTVAPTTNDTVLNYRWNSPTPAPAPAVTANANNNNIANDENGISP